MYPPEASMCIGVGLFLCTRSFRYAIVLRFIAWQMSCFHTAGIRKIGLALFKAILSPFLKKVYRTVCQSQSTLCSPHLHRPRPPYIFLDSFLIAWTIPLASVNEQMRVRWRVYEVRACIERRPSSGACLDYML